MGDMADFTNDGWPDDECWIPDVTCKYCGKSGFEWTLTEDGWRLTTYNTGRIHRCKAFKEFQHEQMLERVKEWDKDNKED